MTNAVRKWRRSLTAHYDYSPWHRLLEIVAIAATVALFSVLSWRIMVDVWLALDWLAASALVGSGLVGYMAADLVSGTVHWLADRFGTPDTPVLGEAFIRPFREHHDFPTDITHHDFVEVNGNNSLVLLMFLLPAYSVLPEELSPAWVCFGGFSMAFPAAIFMTNQFHKWAHTKEPPAPVVWMQARGLILSKQAHDRHHTPPHDSDYCITSGWLNPLLDRLDVFARCERLFKRPAPPTANGKGADASV